MDGQLQADNRSEIEADAWRDNAESLADWATNVLINRSTAWGSYLPLKERIDIRRADGTTRRDVSRTSPPIKDRGKVLLTKKVLVRHFRGEDVGHIVGLHSTNNEDSTCRWFSIDIDHHAGDGSAAPDANWQAALAWYQKLRQAGFRPLLVQSNGAGGYRIWQIFDRPLPSQVVYAFAQWVVADYAAFGMEKAPETFPKQPSITPHDYGNWARLPGLHHSRPHWTRVWAGDGWLEGAAAVMALLGNRGDHATPIPSEAAPKPPDPPDPPKPRPLPERSEGLMREDEIVRRCLDGLKPDRCDDYASWILVGQILHWVEHSYGRPMLDEWATWSSRSAKYATGECEARWRSFRSNHPRAAKLASLISMAREDGACIFPGDPNDPRGRGPRRPSPGSARWTSAEGSSEGDGDPDEDGPAACVKAAVGAAKETYDPSLVFDASDDIACLDERSYAKLRAELRKWKADAGVDVNLADLDRVVKDARKQGQRRRVAHAGVGRGAAPSTEPGDKGGDQRAEASDHRPDFLLVPGAHLTDAGEYIEVGTHSFADSVLRRVPADAIYSMGDVPGQIIRKPGSRVFRVLDPDATRMLVDSYVRLGKWVKLSKDEGQAFVFLPTSRDLGGLVLSRATAADDVRRLQMLVRYPTFTSNFTPTRPGWNDNGVFYDQPPELADIVPETDVDTIQMVLEDLLVDFPFRGEVDRQNFIGGMVTVMVAPALNENRPMHLVQASLERTGKTKLIEQVLGHTFLGRKVPAEQFAGSEEERDKRVTSVLIGQDTIVHLDNLKEFIDSAVLASLLTASEYRGRLLGQSQMVTLPNNLILFGSGNNVQGTGEIIKRVVPIFLQPQTSDPQRRQEFTHPKLPEYVQQVRPRVLAALTGMVQVWKSAGMPDGEQPLGGFEKWARTVGGIMAACGYTEWLANVDTWVREADPRSGDLEAFVEEWAEKHNHYARPAKYLAGIARSMGLFGDCFVAASERAQLTSFGMKVLSRHVDAPVGRWRIKRTGTGSNAFYFLSDLANPSHVRGPERDKDAVELTYEHAV